MRSETGTQTDAAAEYQAGRIAVFRPQKCWGSDSLSAFDGVMSDRGQPRTPELYWKDEAGGLS